MNWWLTRDRVTVVQRGRKIGTQAIREILDRDHGQPTQAHEHGGLGGGPVAADLTGAADEQLAAPAALFGPLAGAGADADGDPSGAEAA